MNRLQFMIIPKLLSLLKNNLIILLLIFFTSIASFGLAKFDSSFSYRWIIFYLYLFSLVTAVLISSHNLHLNFTPLKLTLKQKLLSGLLLIFLFSRFIGLSIYPFIALGDEVRDGGLNAQQILNGEIKNIFAYGRYGAHGLIIPTFTAAFYRIFGDSVMSYRFPASLLSVINVVIIFVLLYQLSGFNLAFWGAIIITLLPLDLYYSRTQIVVVFSEILTTILLFAVYIYYRSTSIWRFVLLGLVVGFSLNFHASVRTFALSILLIIISQEFIKKIDFVKKNIILLIFLLIGFGPRFWFSPPSIFFHTSRLGSFTITDLVSKYYNSLLVWGINPTRSFYADNQPIFPILTFILILFGITSILLKKTHPLLKILVFFFFCLPFTNSAITDNINFDHRLSPLFVVGAILAAQGISYLGQFLHRRNVFYCFQFIYFSYILYHASLFYTQGKANYNWNNQYGVVDYLSMHTIYFIKSHSQQFYPNVCLEVSPSNIAYFKLMHIQEQYSYFLSNYTVDFKSNVDLADYQILISPNCGQLLSNTYQINCSLVNSTICPKNYSHDILIQY